MQFPPTDDHEVDRAAGADLDHRKHAFRRIDIELRQPVERAAHPRQGRRTQGVHRQMALIGGFIPVVGGKGGHRLLLENAGEGLQEAGLQGTGQDLTLLLTTRPPIPALQSSPTA